MAEFKNFKTGGPGSEAVEFVGSWDCFDAPSNTVFVVRVENKIQIRDIVCGLQLKKCMLYSKNFLNQTQNIWNMGARLVHQLRIRIWRQQ